LASTTQSRVMVFATACAFAKSHTHSRKKFVNASS
jgi:hypothetical protein